MNRSKSKTRRQPRRLSRKTPKSTALSGFSNPRESKFSGCFVPDRLVTSLRLEGQVENAASSTYAESGFTINDMFDPQGGSGASQCVGFDQLALLYRRYRVIASHVKVILSLNSTSGTPTATAMEAQLVVYPSNVTTAATTVADGKSQPFAKTAFVSAEKPATLTHSVNIAKFIGDTVSADRLQALISASPASVLYWHFGVISRAYTTVVTVIDAQITYEVEFFERALLDRSSLAYEYVRKAYQARCSELLEPTEWKLDHGHYTVDRREPDTPVLIQKPPEEKFSTPSSNTSQSTHRPQSGSDLRLKLPYRPPS
jgi:hypothetical protein